MIFHFLRREPEHTFNHKRMYRIWIGRGSIYASLRSVSVLTVSTKPCLPLRELTKVGPWTLLAIGWGPTQKSVRVINIMDEGSRRALWTEAHASISAHKLIEVLNQVIEVRGQLATSGAIMVRVYQPSPEAVASKRGVELRFIQPGKPMQNGLIERLNKTLRVECLNLTWFTTMQELNEELQDWSQTYNWDRPHSSLNHQTPAEYEIEHQISTIYR